jgi:hypothetical protein
MNEAIAAMMNKVTELTVPAQDERPLIDDMNLVTQVTPEIAVYPLEPPVRSQSELDEIESQALSVVNNIQEKMELIDTNATEGTIQELPRRAVDVHVLSSHVKNPA